ncbi:ADP-dependent glucokinase/phosphofructokinase [Actinoplanes bogorensis]|uniref:ADP-dependent glucokinase/phosphofructokinase n=1 Tax=Paractinoplanes bogorensis TaxID=1610840 RepID=A0ABS5YNZ7_9ACTN|nr:ADP-dependent glucokinase/phosphofructokinase [Actinoplanes bogorensis]MBU2665041.1 ADP-dependent glucokinase/phosphofructokinase [Actinoplanes bogorensis]
MSDASRVVLGLGGCVDYELKLTAEVLEQLITTYGISAVELTSPTAAVAGERDLVVSILGYVARGQGGEHFVASAPALSTFADRFPHRTTLGGTSVRAGLLLDRLGIPSALHLVTVNDDFRRLLPADGEWFNSGTDDTFYPHLIVQFDAGLHVRSGDIDITSPFPNRLIYVNDPANETMRLTDDLGDRLAQASVFLISGFNAMRDPALLDDRLRALRTHMAALPASAVTYFEDAAYHEPSFSARVRSAILDRVDVYGLNEDELQTYLSRTVDLLSPHEVADAVTSLFELIPAPAIVLHTKYWAAVFGSHADAYVAAVEAGVLMAATRYVHGDHFTDEDIASVRRRPRRPAGFGTSLESLMDGRARVIPGYILDVADPTTVGLGDTFVGGFLSAIAGVSR